MKNLLLTALAVTMLPSLALAAGPVPPAKLEKNSHNAWLAQLGASASPYADYAFAWLEAQKTRALPAQVMADPDKIFVSTDGPLAATMKLEGDGTRANPGTGEVVVGTSAGLETYGLIDADVNQVLETILFRWGKPVGKTSGITFPHDTVFSYREERAAPEWAPNAYKTLTFKRLGGVVNDMNDIFAMVVRGNATEGYTLVGSFLAPYTEGGLETTTSTYITMIYIRPVAGGKTDYRVAGILTGQTYYFGGDGTDEKNKADLAKARANFGFNAKKIREGQKGFYAQVKALKDTGKIPERKK